MYTSFKEMPVWKNAMEIAEEIFRLSENFPRKEDFGLTSQMRRSALSISANIAEAYGRNHTYEKVNFYYYGKRISNRNTKPFGIRKTCWIFEGGPSSASGSETVQTL